MPIKVDYIGNANQKLALIVLDRSKSLNAINTKMYKKMFSVLEEIKTDEKVVSVLFHSEIDKAFCAGGDVKGMMNVHDNFKENVWHAKEFFTAEYSFDLYLREYPKPTLTWGQGYVMGGGFGLFMATDIRMVTPSSRLSMPEINIGLFPDVGASHFLNKIPKYIARFIAMTSGRLSGADAKKIKLATHLCEEGAKKDILSALSKLSFSGVKSKDLNVISEMLLRFEVEDQNFELIDRLEKYQDQITAAKNILELDSVLHNIYKENPNGRLANDIENYFYGSSLSKVLIFELLKRGESLSVKEAFLMEWVVAVNCYRKGDFCEGVRALLIDKDRNPKWKYNSLQDVGSIDEFFLLEKGEANDLELFLRQKVTEVC